LTLGEAAALSGQLRPTQRRKVTVEVRQLRPGLLLRTFVLRGRPIGQAVSAVSAVPSSASSP
jgi:hypothetical protein